MEYQKRDILLTFGDGIWYSLAKGDPEAKI